MIKIYKMWWAWEYEMIENWLEKMEASGLRLIEARCNGVLFLFEKCKPTKARYCVDYQTKLTPDYMAIINDDGWKLYQIGMGWYILRKEYEEERPDLYTDFEGLIARNKTLLAFISFASIIEIVCISTMVYDTYINPSQGSIAMTAIFGSVITALFAFIITNLSLQIKKFRKTP